MARTQTANLRSKRKSKTSSGVSKNATGAIKKPPVTSPAPGAIENVLQTKKVRLPDDYLTALYKILHKKEKENKEAAPPTEQQSHRDSPNGQTPLPPTQSGSTDSTAITITSA